MRTQGAVTAILFLDIERFLASPLNKLLKKETNLAGSDKLKVWFQQNFPSFQGKIMKRRGFLDFDIQGP